MKIGKVRLSIPDVIQACLAGLFFLGVLTILGPCAARDDGVWMTCHWAGMAERGVTGALFVLALSRFLPIGPQRKQGLDFAIIILCGLTALIPGGLIPLCMMDTMRCHTVMVPAVRVFAALLAASAVLDCVLQWRVERKTRSASSDSDGRKTRPASDGQTSGEVEREARSASDGETSNEV